MAQTIKLKRTAVQGKIPTTSNLDLGELAINTHDGRLFFQKDDGTLSIQEILTTNSQTSGSFNLTGAISASSLSISGDTTIGGNLTLGGNITIGDASTDSVTVTAQFSGSLIPDGNEIYDLGSSVKKWNNTYTKNLITTNITATSFTGSIAATNGIVSGSSQLTSSFDSRYLNVSGEGNISGSFTGSFVGDGSGLTNLSVDVGETTTVTSSFDNVSSISITHSFDSRNILVSVYDTNYAQIIPQSVTLTSNSVVDVVLSSAHSGHVVVAKGGHIVSGSQIQIDEITSLNDTFTNQTSYTVNHTFETKNVFVTVYGTDDEQIIPATVSTPTTSSVVLEFDDATSGRVVVGKAGHIVSGSTAADFNQLTNKPSGLVSGSSQLTGSLNTIYALSGSVGGGTSDFTELTNVPSGLVSGSTQIISSLPSGTISGSTQITDGSGLVSGSSQVEFNDVNNTPFSQSATEVTTTKSIVPSTSTLDLGTATNPFRDLYLSSASLYIDGQQVISSTSDVLTFTTDEGQSIKLLETGGDDIIFQTSTGNIELKGTVELESGKKIIDSAGTKIEFGDSLGITGSIDLTGTVDGIDLQSFSSSIATQFGSLSTDYGDLQNIPSGIVSGSSQVTISDTTGFSTFSSSIDTSIQTEKGRIDAILSSSDADKDSFAEIVTLINSVDTTNDNAFASHYTSSNDRLSSLEGFTSSIDTTIKTKLNTEGVISGSSQVTITESQISDLTHYTNSDVLTYINSLSVVSGSVSSYTDSDNTDHLNSLGVISGSSQITTLTSHTETFTAQTAVTASHSLGTKNVTISVYDNDDYMIFPTSIRTYSTSEVHVQFNTSRSGRIVITK